VRSQGLSHPNIVARAQFLSRQRDGLSRDALRTRPHAARSHWPAPGRPRVAGLLRSGRPQLSAGRMCIVQRAAAFVAIHEIDPSRWREEIGARVTILGCDRPASGTPSSKKISCRRGGRQVRLRACRIRLAVRAQAERRGQVTPSIATGAFSHRERVHNGSRGGEKADECGSSQAACLPELAR